ncbi:MAG: hypothetical protein CFE33_09815 [Pseudorhodobacter sp. PARRP1]|nr:MAG: hypothetical protein CFE33_09815 [Pseudorhodobacter sp. PARRP1]
MMADHIGQSSRSGCANAEPPAIRQGQGGARRPADASAPANLEAVAKAKSSGCVAEGCADGAR